MTCPSTQKTSIKWSCLRQSAPRRAADACRNQPRPKIGRQGWTDSRARRSCCGPPAVISRHSDNAGWKSRPPVVVKSSCLIAAKSETMPRIRSLGAVIRATSNSATARSPSNRMARTSRRTARSLMLGHWTSGADLGTVAAAVASNLEHRRRDEITVALEGSGLESEA